MTFHYLFDRFKSEICYIRVVRVVIELPELLLSCLEFKLRVLKLSLKPFDILRLLFKLYFYLFKVTNLKSLIFVLLELNLSNLAYS